MPGLELNIYFVHWAILMDKPGFPSSIYADFPSVTDTIHPVLLQFEQLFPHVGLGVQGA